MSQSKKKKASDSVGAKRATVNVEWFGHAAHFICGRWCRFHLATLVGEYLVSTVGQYVHPRHGAGTEQGEAAWLEKNPNGEEIGYKRFYETMVFKAGKPCTAKGCGCGLPTIDGGEVDFMPYNDAGAANRGHAAMIEVWREKQMPVASPRKASRLKKGGPA